MLLLIQPILVIIAGAVFAAMLDGGVRLLRRVLPIGRGWRPLIAVLAVLPFLLATVTLTGVQLVEQFTQLRATIAGQAQRLAGWL